MCIIGMRLKVMGVKLFEKKDMIFKEYIDGSAFISTLKNFNPKMHPKVSQIYQIPKFGQSLGKARGLLVLFIFLDIPDSIN